LLEILASNPGLAGDPAEPDTDRDRQHYGKHFEHPVDEAGVTLLRQAREG
jgi:hypothetical protein